MPAKSEKQRELMAIAERHPEKVSPGNRGVLKMSHQQLHDFASTRGLHKSPSRTHRKPKTSKGYGGPPLA